MKNNQYTFDLPTFILGSFIFITLGSALGIMIQALMGTL